MIHVGIGMAGIRAIKSNTPDKITSIGTSTSSVSRPVCRRIEMQLAAMKNGEITTVTLSMPPMAIVMTPTIASPSVQTQSILGATPSVLNNQPVPIVIRRTGTIRDFLSGFIRVLFVLAATALLLLTVKRPSRLLLYGVLIQPTASQFRLCAGCQP